MPSPYEIGHANMPRVSAVIPTFGRPELLKRAVDSVLAQTMAEVEVIVVIDGHDPETLAYLDAETDPRLRYIAHDSKRGAGQTRDTGADAARAHWVAFLDDDDEWLPEKLEHQLALAPADGRAVLMTRSRVVTPQGEFIRPLALYDGSLPVDEWLFDRTTWLSGGQSFVQTSSLMFPKAMFDTLRFRDTHQHEEWELVIRAVKQLGYPLLTAPGALVIHYAGQPRPRLSHSYTWKVSVEWARGLKDYFTPKGYSGFILSHVGQSAAKLGQYDALLPLVRESFRAGRPTLRQLFRYAVCWAVPVPVLLRLRAMVQGERKRIRSGQS
jgi:glycosyltransferase involved in cell wall biosynthesis